MQDYEGTRSGISVAAMASEEVPSCSPSYSKFLTPTTDAKAQEITNNLHFSSCLMKEALFHPTRVWAGKSVGSGGGSCP